MDSQIMWLWPILPEDSYWMCATTFCWAVMLHTSCTLIIEPVDLSMCTSPNLLKLQALRQLVSWRMFETEDLKISSPHGDHSSQCNKDTLGMVHSNCLLRNHLEILQFPWSGIIQLGVQLWWHHWNSVSLLALQTFTAEVAYMYSASLALNPHQSLGNLMIVRLKISGIH
jgi:hypothetical protein